MGKQVKDEESDTLVAVVVILIILAFPIIFVVFIKYGDWVTNLLGLN